MHLDPRRVVLGYPRAVVPQPEAGEDQFGESLLSLDPDRVDLWYVVPESIQDPALLSAYRDLLSEDEIARSERFHFERDRHRFLVTRSLVRTVLSRYAAVRPQDWTFRENDHGRPEISGPLGASRIRFNVSHTHGFIACLVGADRELGVDVESTRRRGKTVEIADRYFSPAEVEQLSRQPAHAQRRRFFEFWTLKEAYIKARGKGLSIPLDQFSFHIEEGSPIRIDFGAELDDDPASWQFHLLRPSDDHILAVGIRRGDGPDVATVQRSCVPLVPPSNA